MARALRSEGHTFAVGPGHDFQTCQSLCNRGDLTGHVYGTAPREWITVTATAQGLARAQHELAPKPAAPPTPRWPFPFSSRGLHLAHLAKPPR